MRTIWFLAGTAAFILGALGVVVPLLPTVPFLLLAAFCFARSSEQAHDWLHNHKTFGPPIKDWKDSGAIRMPAKITASVCIVAGFTASFVFGVATWVLAFQAVVLSCVALFIWTRPNG